MHFHWGETEMYGSEHRADGAKCANFFFSHLLLYHFSLELIELSYTSSTPMELHVVHFKTQYLNLESALRQVDGVIIIVYFLKVII